MSKSNTTFILKSFCLTGIAIFFCIHPVQAQTAKDTSVKILDEVIVTATRSEHILSNVAVPAAIISKQTILQSGSVRLNDILNEQSGIFITSSFGNGIQMQGLNPDYTLILIDGEPVIGRTGGVLDLSRITVNNIRKIEVVKGPSSSLYGSEALAGVINIITEKPTETNAEASLRYGSFGTTDINANGASLKNKYYASLQSNYYSAAGYDLNRYIAGNTQDPFHNYTLQFKTGYSISAKTAATLNVRYFKEEQRTKPYSAKDASDSTQTISGDATIDDANIHAAIEHHFSDKLKSSLHFYYTNYKAVTNQVYAHANTSENYSYYDYFKQNLARIEDQTDWKLNNKMNLITGAGWTLDNVRSNRYDENIVTRKNNIGYVFTQYEWNPTASWLIFAGARYDYNENYQSHVSPKIAIQKRLGHKIRINASVGGGFKAPDFRQLYLNFTNNAAGTGYTVLGNLEVQSGMQHLQQQGEIQSIFISPAAINPLKPETSVGMNAGVNYSLTPQFNINLNLFRNDIKDLIDFKPIAQKTNNAYVYSYFNLNKIYTQGLETELSCKLTKTIQLIAGYQLLYTADKDALKAIKEENVFGRDKGVVYQLTTNDYKGLFNRSRNMANLKIFYENNKGWFANIRSIYRSGWGAEDTDGNGYFNRGDQLSKDFLEINFSAGKSFHNGLKVQAGCDNLFNYKDIQYSPNVQGRVLYATISYSFIRNQNKSK